jgi:hypothetical protein
MHWIKGEPEPEYKEKGWEAVYHPVPDLRDASHRGGQYELMVGSREGSPIMTVEFKSGARSEQFFCFCNWDLSASYYYGNQNMIRWLAADRGNLPINIAQSVRECWALIQSNQMRQESMLASA